MNFELLNSIRFIDDSGIKSNDSELIKFYKKAKSDSKKKKPAKSKDFSIEGLKTLFNMKNKNEPEKKFPECNNAVGE